MQKALVLRPLIGVLPAGEFRTDALEQYLDALHDLNSDGSRSPVWFAFARQLLELAVALDGSDRLRVNGAIDTEPVLSLYKRLNDAN